MPCVRSARMEPNLIMACPSCLLIVYVWFIVSLSIYYFVVALFYAIVRFYVLHND